MTPTEIKPRGVYRHPGMIDLDMYVIAIEREDEEKLVLRVLWVYRKNPEMGIVDKTEINLKRVDIQNWREIKAPTPLRNSSLKFEL